MSYYQSPDPNWGVWVWLALIGVYLAFMVAIVCSTLT